jgi:hypothetical protein
MSRVAFGAVLLALVAVAPAVAEPYWITWEGDDFPDNQGWTRVWGKGQYQGPGAYRTLENGILTYDSLYDPGVYDFSRMERPGQMDPGLGELFVLEWRLRVEQVDGRADPDVGVCSDHAWAVGFEFAEDRIYSVFEHYLTIPIVPYVWHEYRLLSSDMRHYELFVDGAVVHAGVFVHKFVTSSIGFGDAIQGAASRHQWDYLRFGTVPEPGAAVLMSTLMVCRRRWRQ